MQILRGDLRQRVELALDGVVEALVAIAEVDGGVPHLQVEEFVTGAVVHERAFAAGEDLGRVHVVHGVAVRAVLRLERQDLLVGHLCSLAQVIRPVNYLVHFSYSSLISG